METHRIIKYAFHAFLLLLSIACFTYHVRGVIEKSLEKKTTLAITQRHFDRLSPPTFTICPGQVINSAKMKKKYNRTYDIFDTNLSYINPTSRPVDTYLDLAYQLHKDLDLVVNAYNKDLKEKNVRLQLGTNKISDAFLGDYSVQLDEIMTGPNGLCYTLSTNVTLTDSMASIFGIFIHFHVPADEIPQSFRGFFESENDFSALNYKSWPGSKPFSFEISISHSNVVAIEREVWNFYEHDQQRKCVYYPTVGSREDDTNFDAQ